jgi:penicillin-binding protein 2
LFIAFAPAEQPRIAVAVIAENGGHGGSVAAPVAKAVMERYLNGSAP